MLQSFVRIACGQVGFGQRDADFDGPISKSTRVCQQDASFAFEDRLLQIAERALQLADRVETAELEFNVARTASERASVLQMLPGSSRFVGQQQPGKQRIAHAKTAVLIVSRRVLQNGLRLATCPRPVAAEEFALCFLYSRKGVKRPSVSLGSELKIRRGGVNIPECEMRGRSISERARRVRVLLVDHRNRTF